MNHAAEIKLRAEQRCGVILIQMAEKGERATGKGSRDPVSQPSIPELGITLDESSRWQKLAQADPADFEAYIAEAKEAGDPLCENEHTSREGTGGAIGPICRGDCAIIRPRAPFRQPPPLDRIAREPHYLTE